MNFRRLTEDRPNEKQKRKEQKGADNHTNIKK